MMTRDKLPNLPGRYPPPTVTPSNHRNDQRMNIPETLPPGWVWTTIGAITTPVKKVDPRKEFPQKEFRYLDISAIDNQHQKISEPKTYYGADAPSRAQQVVEAGDVLFSTVRTYLKNIASVPKELHGHIASTGFAVLRLVEGFASQYLFYYTLSEDFLYPLAELQRGTSYPAVRDDDVRSQKIPLAPLPEQRRIVAAIETHFSRLDAAVAKLKRIQANLKRYRAAVLKAACEGRLVTQDPGDEPADQLLTRILAERRRHWQAANPGKKYTEPAAPQTDDLPPLPSGWVWARVKQVGHIQLGRQRAPQHHTGPYMRPYLRVANVFEDHIDTSDILEMNFTPNEYEIYKLKYGDILLNEGQSPEFLGRPAIYRNQVPGACFQNTLVRFQAFEGLLPEFALSVFRFYMHSGRFRKISQITTNIAHLSAGRFSEIEFPLPPLAEQTRIVAEVEQRLSVIDAMEKSVTADLQRAARLRQAILKRAFSGRLVAQAPTDEPASRLLERIKSQ